MQLIIPRRSVRTVTQESETAIDVEITYRAGRLTSGAKKKKKKKIRMSIRLFFPKVLNNTIS